jgi:hypothetical protein
MHCCNEMTVAMDREMVVKSEIHLLMDGRVLNDFHTEYFLKGGGDGGPYTYLGFNYCPFCGRALSRGLWAAEKKK